MKNAIEIKNVIKKYDMKFQLGELNLNIPSGMITGLIGENGAGKTTLIKVILNLLTLDEGEIKIFDKDSRQQENEIKEDIGVVLDNMFFPEILTPKDVNACMREIYKHWDSELFYKYLERFQLPTNKLIKTLSKGMRKKLEIATALAHHPKLLILDEATSGLDPIARADVLEVFQEFIQDESNTILFSTHITTDLESIADYIVFIDQGQVLLNEARDEIMDQYGVLRCDIKEMSKIDKEDIMYMKKNKYNMEILVKNRSELRKKYQDFVIDKITLEELMLLMIKGEK